MRPARLTLRSSNISRRPSTVDVDDARGSGHHQGAEPARDCACARATPSVEAFVEDDGVDVFFAVGAVRLAEEACFGNYGRGRMSRRVEGGASGSQPLGPTEGVRRGSKRTDRVRPS